MDIIKHWFVQVNALYADEMQAATRLCRSPMRRYEAFEHDRSGDASFTPKPIFRGRYSRDSRDRAAIVVENVAVWYPR
ncbi:MAG: hypothetical protein WBP68_06875 [Candidatus Binatus sp.]